MPPPTPPTPPLRDEIIAAMTRSIQEELDADFLRIMSSGYMPPVTPSHIDAAARFGAQSIAEEVDDEILALLANSRAIPPAPGLVVTQEIHDDRLGSPRIFVPGEPRTAFVDIDYTRAPMRVQEELGLSVANTAGIRRLELTTNGVLPYVWRPGTPPVMAQEEVLLHLDQVAPEGFVPSSPPPVLIDQCPLCDDYHTRTSACPASFAPSWVYSPADGSARVSHFPPHIISQRFDIGDTVAFAKSRTLWEHLLEDDPEDV
jgi:hypothetical protein